MKLIFALLFPALLNAQVFDEASQGRVTEYEGRPATGALISLADPTAVPPEGLGGFHGSATGYLRRTDWLANGFFANRAGQPVSNQPLYKATFSLSGPITIPNFYRGHNKTFFYALDDISRDTNSSTILLSVPTPRELGGDFSQSFNNGTRQVIYNPRSLSSTGARVPFPGNVIPFSNQSPAGQLLASYYPAPNAPTPYYSAPNYTYTGNYASRADQRFFRLDHRLTSWIQASSAFTYQKVSGGDSSGNIFLNAGSPDQTLYQRNLNETVVRITLTPDPATVATLGWKFNRLDARTAQASQGFSVASLGLPPSLASATANPAFPAIGMDTAAGACSVGASLDFSDFGGGCATRDIYYSRSFNAVASRVAGRHMIQAGVDVRTVHDAGTPATGPTSLAFSEVFTRANQISATEGTGSSLATLLLGYPTSGAQTVVTPFDNFIQTYRGFVLDNYRAASGLTLIFGLDLEHQSGIQEKHNRLVSGFDAVTGQTAYAGVNGAPAQTGNPLPVKPGVRLGVAWKLDRRTVVRAGYGIYQAPLRFDAHNAVGYSQTTALVASTNTNLTPAVTLANPYPNGLLQPTGKSLAGFSGFGQPIAVYSPAARSAGYVQAYSVEIQRELVEGFVLTLGATASRGDHLLSNGQNIDQLNPALIPRAQVQTAATPGVTNPFYGNGGVGTLGTAKVSPIQLLLPFPQYTSVTLLNADTGSSRYYASYFRAQKHFSDGLSLLASYRWSRSEDDLPEADGPQNSWNPAGERSLSSYDTPNRFSAAVTYQIPTGRRSFSSIPGGWTVCVVSTIQNGYPLPIAQYNGNSIFGAGYQRPNATGINPATSGTTDQRIDGWLNPAAFSTAGTWAFGNVSRLAPVRGPGLFNQDFAVYKSFATRERLKLQFRAEASNATNTVQFSNPVTNTDSANFGRITGQINHPRLIRVGLSLFF